jgi:ankyrin repeat protein
MSRVKHGRYNNKDMTILDYAIYTNNTDRINFLLNCGAIPIIKNCFTIIKNRNLDVIKYLSNKYHLNSVYDFMEFNPMCPKWLGNKFDKNIYKRNLLQYAAQMNDVPIVKFLMEKYEDDWK